MVPTLLKYLPIIATILAASSLALVSATFALFLKPRLTTLDTLKSDFSGLDSHIKTLKIADNLNALQKLQQDFAELIGRDIAIRIASSEEALKLLSTEVAVLKQSETERNQRLNAAIDAQANSIRSLNTEIAEKVARGDNENLIKLLTWRVEQLETKYTLSKIQGGIREEETRDEWARAKDDLARALNPQVATRAQTSS